MKRRCLFGLLLLFAFVCLRALAQDFGAFGFENPPDTVREIIEAGQ